MIYYGRKWVCWFGGCTYVQPTPGMRCDAWSDPEATDEIFNKNLPCRALGRRFALGSIIEAGGRRLRQLVQRCRRLSPLGSKSGTMYDINVRGTQELILAAAEAGVKRMIYTSSVATPGTHQDGIPVRMRRHPPVL